MTKMEAIQKALELADKLQHVFVATADAKGLPHMATAGKLRLKSDGRVAVAAWFCPGTVINLQHNHRVALVVWDAIEDTGYQLVGEVQRMEELAFLDGYAPGTEGPTPSPQVERQLIIRVDMVLGFSHAPHSDVVE
jgi:hypothetical protein